MEMDEFNTVIELIKFKNPGITEQDIALEVKSNANYISQMRSKGKVTDSFIRKLKIRYPEAFKSIEKQEISVEKSEEIILAMAARQQVQSRYIAEIYAKTANMSVTRVLTEMEQLEKEGAERLLKSLR